MADVTGLDPAERTARLTAAVAEAVAALDVEAGAVLRVILCRDAARTRRALARARALAPVAAAGASRPARPGCTWPCTTWRSTGCPGAILAEDLNDTITPRAAARLTSTPPGRSA